VKDIHWLEKQEKLLELRYSASRAFFSFFSTQIAGHWKIRAFVIKKNFKKKINVLQRTAFPYIR
jgi:hypothetical protein